MTILATYWGFWLILGLVAAESAAAGLSRKRTRPEEPKRSALTGPKRISRRRGVGLS